MSDHSPQLFLGLTTLLGGTILVVVYYLSVALKEKKRLVKVRDGKDGENEGGTRIGWGYGENNGPCHWHELNSKEYSLCKDGKKQSPINIDTSMVIDSNDCSDCNNSDNSDNSDSILNCKDIVIDYPCIDNGFVINNGLTIMVHTTNDFNFDRNDSYTESNPSHYHHRILQSGLFGASKQMALQNVNGNSTNMEYEGHIVLFNEKYYLEQFHFHTPSEHSIDGKFADLELHFVHQSENKQLAVLGLLFQVSDNINHSSRHPFLAQFWHYLPSNENVNKEYFFQKNLNNLVIDMGYIKQEIVNHGSLLCYHGSLTTPPCSEGVKWFVLNKNEKISMHELNHFKKCLNGIQNVRPIQDIFHRKVSKCSQIHCH